MSAFGFAAKATGSMFTPFQIARADLDWSQHIHSSNLTFFKNCLPTVRPNIANQFVDAPAGEFAEKRQPATGPVRHPLTQLGDCPGDASVV